MSGPLSPSRPNRRKQSIHLLVVARNYGDRKDVSVSEVNHKKYVRLLSAREDRRMQVGFVVSSEINRMPNECVRTGAERPPWMLEDSSEGGCCPKRKV